MSELITVESDTLGRSWLPYSSPTPVARYLRGDAWWFLETMHDRNSLCDSCIHGKYNIEMEAMTCRLLPAVFDDNYEFVGIEGLDPPGTENSTLVKCKTRKIKRRGK